MKKIDLPEEDLQALMQALNAGTEPPPELAKKLFPSQFTHDFKTLHDARIPTIEYAGKRPEAAILSEASVMGAACPLQLERCFDGGKINKQATQLMLIKESAAEYEAGWRNLIVQGDNLQFLKTCYLNQDPIIRDKVKGKVQLVYIDPPFATKSDFQAKEGEESYRDRIDRAEFIEGLRERLIFIHEVLANDGSIFVHLDQKMCHYVKIVLDEIFGKENLRNEIIWCYFGPGSPGMRQFNRKHDSILWYSKSGQWSFNQDAARVAHDEKTAENFKTGLRGSGFIAGEYEIPKGKVAEDHWTMAVAARYPIDGIKRVGYPTEKPLPLLERIVNVCSAEGDLVMDVFAGGGSFCAAAEKLGRRWIACDFGKHSVYSIQKRMTLMAQAFGNDTLRRKYELIHEPYPFAVVSVGAFDFAKIMNLRENQDAYISFVLGIFGLAERDDNLAAKYNITNVCALKDGNPVEIYPVWDDEYLRDVRVDMDYLEGIVAQAGGKLRGDYYIIAPETCVRVGETTIPTGKNRSVTFKPLTFPYKVLEEAARNFTIEEQPSSADNINKLISSVGFYFNEAVTLRAEKTRKGFRITEFSTSILDKEERRYTGLDGLAMILIDTDYEADKGFTVDTVIYQKDIKDGEVAAKGVNGKTRIIAIDRYGNESPISKLA
jgi:DNA modification methylase